MGEASHPEEQCEEGAWKERCGRGEPGTGAVQGMADLQLRQRLERGHPNTLTALPVGLPTGKC